MIQHNASIVPIIEYSSELNQIVIEQLKRKYPVIETGEIGKSVMGKSLTYIKIGKGEKEIFYSAAIHANEWITTPVLLKFVEAIRKELRKSLLHMKKYRILPAGKQI